MKTIFFSDVHYDLSSLEELISKEEGIFYCLGDSEFPKEVLEKYNIISVRGNCDKVAFDNELIIKIDNLNILLTHGHLHNVKYTLDNLFYYTQSKDCNVVVFGHTHRITFIDENIKMYNPGSLKEQRSYLIYENNEFKIKYL